LLTASEAARLAAVLPSPRRWKANAPGPYVQKRTNWILRQMGYGPKATPEDEPEPPDDESDDGHAPIEPLAAPAPEVHPGADNAPMQTDPAPPDAPATPEPQPELTEPVPLERAEPDTVP
jgi:monofunctional biosynthetic peptidoglycan transglycosylase